jgi:hypothetical protein
MMHFISIEESSCVAMFLFPYKRAIAHVLLDNLRCRLFANTQVESYMHMDLVSSTTSTDLTILPSGYMFEFSVIKMDLCVLLLSFRP